MKKVFVNVDYQVLSGGAIKPVRIYWHDGRAFNIRKTLHSCTSEDDFEGIRYDVGDKFGFVKATIDFSLNRDDLKEKVREYIETIVKEDK